MAARAPAPGEQMRTLEAALAGGLPRAVVVRGEERWYRERALARAVEVAAAAGLEVVRHDARDPDFDLRGLIADLTEAPLFATARCVVVRSLAQLLKKDAGSEREPPLAAPLLAYLGGRSPEGCLVLDAEGVRADSAVIKKAVAVGAPVLEMRRLYDSPPPWGRESDPRRTELVQWVLGRARERQIPLTPDEALYVATATGNDLSALDGALTRLEGRGRESVKSLVAWEAGMAPWDVAEHVLRGDATRGVAGLETLFRSGFGKGGEREVDPGALLAILLGSLRNKARDALAGARAVAERADPIAAVGFKGPPTGREELLARIRLRSADEWERLLEDVVALERSSRQGKDDGGAEIDVNALAAFALRWRLRARGTA